MEDPNQIGDEFERQVEEVLQKLCKLHPTLIQLERHPTIKLESGERRIADFHLAVQYPHECRHYLIECQKRKRYSKEIGERIYYTRGKSKWKTFFFVYSANKKTPKVLAALKDQGVTVVEFSNFELWTKRLGDSLKEKVGVDPDKPKIEVFELAPLAFRPSLGQRLLKWVKLLLMPIAVIVSVVGIVTILTPVLSRSQIGRDVVALISNVADQIGYVIDRKTAGSSYANAFNPDRVSSMGFKTIIKEFPDVEVHYITPKTTNMITVVIPSADDFHWLLTGLPSPPGDIKADWTISEKSNIECIESMQRNARTLINEAQSDAFYAPEGEFGTFFSNAVKRISEARANHISGMLQVGNQWLLFCELSGSSEQEPVYMLYSNLGYWIVKPPTRLDTQMKHITVKNGWRGNIQFGGVDILKVATD